MIPVVFLSGPFRSMADPYDQWEQTQNIRRAEELSLEVWKIGAAPVTVHLLTVHLSGTLPDKVWLDGDLAILAKCDAVLMLPAWQRSAGATAEFAFAVDRGIPVFYSVDELTVWMEGAVTAA